MENLNKEKQIEELIEELIEDINDIDDNGYAYNEDGYEINGFANARKIATELVERKGYRKQSEGEWIDKPTGAYRRRQSWCSACGKHSGIGGIESNRHKPYCPNCGAKMKGGE